MWRGPERLRGLRAFRGGARAPRFSHESALGVRCVVASLLIAEANPESGARTRTHSEGPAATGQKGKPFNAPNERLDAVWYDTRNAANNTDSQLFYSYSTDAGVTWSPNVAVSAAFNPFEGYPNQNKIGDYITIVSDNTGRQRGVCRHF